MTQLTAARVGLRGIVSKKPDIPRPACGYAPPTSAGRAGDPGAAAGPVWVANLGVRGGTPQSLEPIQLSRRMSCSWCFGTCTFTWHRHLCLALKPLTQAISLKGLTSKRIKHARDFSQRCYSGFPLKIPRAGILYDATRQKWPYLFFVRLHERPMTIR